MQPTDQIVENILTHNEAPLAEFLGLTAKKLFYLLYEPFTDSSPVRLRTDIDDETLDRIPLFRIAEEYLKIIQRDKFIKLTPLGALPKKVMVELYEHHFLLDEYIESGLIKLWKEEDCISILSMKIAIGTTGLLKKLHNKLSLTKKGEKLLKVENRSQLFHAFFHAFTQNFNWGFNDGFTDQPIGQLGWAYSVLMLAKFGNQEQTVDAYADRYLNVFPNSLSLFSASYTSPKNHFSHCFGVRTFERFLYWFGFVTVSRHGIYMNHDKDKFVATDLISSVFIFEETK
ncbi:MAG: hypothetical protein ABI378_14350 [Chitinophagaceae bacterium]